MNGNPFSIDDLSRPADEGRSLHDELSAFFREVMNLSTPIKILPSVLDVKNAFSKVTIENVRFSQLKLDMQVTKLNDLWISSDKPPSSQAGIVWQAVQEIKTPADDVQEIKTPDAGKKKKRTEICSSSRKGGRQKGAKNFKDTEVASLLDVIEDLLPCGANKWEKVALDHYNNGWDTNRDSQMCKRKFDKLWSIDKPTGSTEIPLLVKRAKDIKEKISVFDCIGHTQANDSDAESDAGIVGTRLFETNGSIRKPITKKERR